MVRYILVLICLYFFSFSYSQEFYLGLDTVRGIEEYKKSQERVKIIGKEYNGELKKEFGDFLKNTKEVFKEIYGTLYTNQEYENYIGQIINLIKSNNPRIKDIEVHPYFVYEETPNASMAYENSLFVNLGLFDILENESQLAMVMAHEMSHCSEKHVLNSFIDRMTHYKSSEVQSKLKEANKEGIDRIDRLNSLAKSYGFSLRQHSRDNEAEADSLGLDLLSNSTYALDEAIQGIKTFSKADSEYFDINVLLMEQFAFDDYPFNEEWIKKPTSIGDKLKYKLTQEQKDSLSTHPNTKMRYEVLSDAIKNKEVKDIIEISNETFEKMKKEFRLQMVNYLVYKKQLSVALYNILKYQKEGDDRIELKKRMYEVLDMMEKSLDNHTLGRYVGIRSPFYPPQYNNLLIFIDNLSVSDLTALKNNYKLKHNL